MVPSYVVELSEIILRLVKQEDRRFTLKLVDFLTNGSFAMNTLRRYVRILVYCQHVTTRIAEELKKNDEPRQS